MNFKKLNEKLTPAYFLIPYLIVFGIFVIFPFFYGIVISLYKWNSFMPSQSQFILFDNYTKMMFDTQSIYYTYFWESLKNTLFFVVISVPLLIVIPLILAGILDKKPMGYRFLRFAFFAPTVLSVSVTILIWTWQFNTQGGFINELLGVFGIGPVAWLQTQPGAWIAILVITIWWTSGTNMVILGAAMKNVDQSFYEAAKIDGAGAITIFWKITLPSIRPQVFAVLILTLIASFNIYGQPDMLTSGGPVIDGEFTTMVLMMRIRSIAFGVNAQAGMASAMAIILGCIIIAISLIQRFITKRYGDE